MESLVGASIKKYTDYGKNIIVSVMSLQIF